MVGYQFAVRLAYRPQEPFARFGQCNALHPASVKRPSRGAKTDAVRGWSRSARRATSGQSTWMTHMALDVVDRRGPHQQDTVLKGANALPGGGVRLE